MTFLNPILLAGLAAVSVPIIIHLLNRRRFQKVVWAAMRFIQASVEQNQRRMRIEDMILLALRCLLLILLAIALARPAILSTAATVFGQSRVTGVVILDNSYSMGVTDGTTTRFDKGRRAAEQVLDSMPSGSATAVFLASDIVREVIPEPTFDFNLARKVLREAAISDRATDVFPALNRAIETLKDRLAVRKEIYLISDGQASGWRQLTEIQSALERTRTEISIHIILVNEHEERNLGVSDLHLASGLAPIKQPLRFEAKVTNFGRHDANNVRASLNVDGEPPSDEFNIDSLPPGATKNVTMFARLREQGFHSVAVRIPGDRLVADDERSLAVRAIPQVKVLLVDGDPGSEPRESETFFLRHALTPVPVEGAEEYFIKVNTINTPELSQARLDDFDGVILANVPDFTDNTRQALEGFLRRGGGLILFPGPRVNVSFYNDQLFKNLEILPAALGGTRGDAAQDSTFNTFQEQGYEHPVTSIWNDPGSGKLSSARFFKFFILLPEAAAQETNATAPTANGPAGEAGPARIVLKYNDGTPAVMERDWGLGRVVLFSSTADTAWNDLAVRPAFLPLLHRVLGAVVQRQDEGLNVRVGEKFFRRFPTEFLDKNASISPPREGQKVRDLRHIEMVNGRPALQYTQTDFAGIYDVSVTEPPLTLKFAAQPDAGESSLEELSPAQLTTLRDVANVVVWSPDMSLRSLAEKSRSGLEFWLPLVIAALLVACTETFLGQWFSRSK